MEENYEYRNEQSNCNLLAPFTNFWSEQSLSASFHNNIPLFPLLTRMAPCEGDLRSTGDDSENFHSLSIHDGGLVRRTTMKHFKERANGRKPPPRLVYKLTAFSEHPKPMNTNSERKPESQITMRLSILLSMVNR